MGIETTEATIQKGYWMALTLTRGSAPLRSYVGQVQAIDDHGIRLTLIDWPTGIAAGNDLFVSWKNLQVSLVATQEHSIEVFIKSAEKWQGEMNDTE